MPIPATSCQAPEPEYIREFDVTASYGVDDLWDKAKMEDVIRYLGGGISLNLPPDFAVFFPKIPNDFDLVASPEDTLIDP